METEKFKRTRRMILSRVLVAPFITTMIVCGTLVYYMAVNLRGQVKEDLTRIADGHRRLIEQFLQERTNDLEFAASTHRLEDFRKPEVMADLLAKLQMGSQAFLDLGAFDEAGNHLAYAGPYDLAGKSYASAEWFARVRERDVYISDVFLGYRNSPHFIIAVKKVEGGRTWYLRSTIDTLFFNNLVENIRVGKTGEAYLINGDGRFQTRQRSGGQLMEEDPERGLYQSDPTKVVTFTADDRLYASGRLSETGWLLVVRQETSDAYAPLLRAVLIATAMIVGGGAVVVVMGFILASGLANQLSIADLEKKQMGTQLIMAGKLAEIGEMSSGVAHEINNPLQVMRAEQTMIEDILGDVEKGGGLLQGEDLRLIHDSVNQISLQIDRCSNITQGLLRFARKSEPVSRALDVTSFIREVVSMVEHRAAVENIRIVLKLEAGLPPIESDPNQLQQVLLNLINNALYALKNRREGGEVRISAGREDSELVVSVADNGCGIAPETLEKIFMPFFTTKPVGEGTGLGLSTVFGIVDRLGGKITVSSEVNTGSVFTVRLPIAAGAGSSGE